MAITFSEILRTTLGHKRVIMTQVTFDSSYPTGGEAIAASDVGLSEISAIFVEATDRAVKYDRTNKKLLVYNPTAAHTHTENTAASYTQNATTSSSTAAAAGQVADTTDLSSFAVAVMIVGI